MASGFESTAITRHPTAERAWQASNAPSSHSPDRPMTFGPAPMITTFLSLSSGIASPYNNHNQRNGLLPATQW
jgi:hypothetical protein